VWAGVVTVQFSSHVVYTAGSSMASRRLPGVVLLTSSKGMTPLSVEAEGRAVRVGPSVWGYAAGDAVQAVELVVGGGCNAGGGGLVGAAGRWEVGVARACAGRGTGRER
jgi:hypothetical protein